MAEMLEEESIINSILQMRLLKQKKRGGGLTKKARLEKKTGKVTSKLEKQK